MIQIIVETWNNLKHTGGMIHHLNCCPAIQIQCNQGAVKVKVESNGSGVTLNKTIYIYYIYIYALIPAETWETCMNTRLSFNHSLTTSRLFPSLAGWPSHRTLPVERAHHSWRGTEATHSVRRRDRWDPDHGLSPRIGAGYIGYHDRKGHHWIKFNGNMLPYATPLSDSERRNFHVCVQIITHADHPLGV